MFRDDGLFRSVELGLNIKFLTTPRNAFVISSAPGKLVIPSSPSLITKKIKGGGTGAQGGIGCQVGPHKKSSISELMAGTEGASTHALLSLSIRSGGLHQHYTITLGEGPTKVLAVRSSGPIIWHQPFIYHFSIAAIGKGDTPKAV
jgi:hypothetical protein